MKQTERFNIACGIFREEIEYLVAQGKIHAHFRYWNSDLHMRPDLIDKTLDHTKENINIACYGTCSPMMDKLSMEGALHKTPGINCCEILLGSEQYRKWRKEGVFFLLPEWAMKWEHVFKDLLGFEDMETARAFMHDMHTSIMYLDTGVIPVPEPILQQMRDYFHMDVTIQKIGLSFLENQINKLINK